MADDHKPDDRKADAKPTDPLASAAAFGMALAAQTVEFWFGVASGLARAGQDMVERHNKGEAGDGAIRPDNSSPVEAAKAATRTVMADVERAARDIAEVAQKAAAPVAPKPARTVQPKPAKTESVKPAPAADNVVVLKPAAAPKAEPAQAPKSGQKTISKTDAAKADAPAGSKPAPSGRTELVAKTANKAAPKPAAKPEPRKSAEKSTAKPSGPSGAKPVAARMMPEDFRAPKSVSRPEKPDDLKKIEGVGPKLEQLLNSLGVWTYAQVAAWAPEEIAYVEDMTGLDGRIGSDKWLEQAASLAKAEG